jgi:hypothetical protein
LVGRGEGEFVEGFCKEVCETEHVVRGEGLEKVFGETTQEDGGWGKGGSGVDDVGLPTQVQAEGGREEPEGVDQTFDLVEPLRWWDCRDG